jgi:hypothetical protein
MAETSDVGLLPRTYFKMPRVPFDFRALALAIAGYLIYQGGGWVVSRIATGGKVDLPGSFLTWFVSLFDGFPLQGLRAFFDNVFGLSGDAANTLEILVGGLWFFAVWSFFGLAIRRIISLRIARDEGLSLREAVAFALKNWVTVLAAPVIIGLAAGLFCLCNMFAGLVMSLPFASWITSILLVPLTVLSTLLLLLIVVGGLFGFPLVGAAAAWERNGSLDAISRAFTYVFARPLQYWLNFFLILVFTAIIAYVGNGFVLALTRSVDAGVVSDHLSVTIDAPPREGVAVEKSDWSDLDEEAREKARQYGEKSGYTGRANLASRGAKDSKARPFAMNWDTVYYAPLGHKVTVFMFWLFLNLIVMGVSAFAIMWFLGASSCLYADLRADVDGTEEDEIHTDEDDAPAAALEGALPPGVVTPSAEAPPASGGAAPPTP